MSAPQNSLLTRVAVSSLDLAVRHWPENSRRWGQALLAEMGEIAEPSAALIWAAGGMLLFLRAMFTEFLRWMKLPVGGRLAGSSLPVGNGPQFPKHSRLATAVVLLAAVTLLFLPSAQEAARTVDASWRGFVPSQRDRQHLEKIAAKAEKEKDAGMLGFVALTYPDMHRGAYFANQAVALDPNLMWIYGSRYSYGGRGNPTVTAEQLKELKSYDPDNAVVYLVTAFVEGEPWVEKASRASRADWKPLGDVLAKDREWMKEMDAAFRAPKYDNYFQRHQELAREAWRKAPSLSLRAIAIGLWSHSIPNAQQIQTYAELRVREALQTGAAGNMKDAEAMLAEVTGLGKRMMAGEATTFEEMVGLGLMKRGLEGYEKVYRASGRTNEANEVAAQLREVETTTKTQIHSYLGWREGFVNGLRWKALVLEAAAMLALLLAFATGLSLLVLEVSAAFGQRRVGWPRRAICRLVDYGPGALFATSLIFLWSFRPIEQVFEQYRSGELNHVEVLGLFWQSFTLGAASPALYFSEPYHRWLVGTIVLAGADVFVIVRGLVRRRTTVAVR